MRLALLCSSTRELIVQITVNSGLALGSKPIALERENRKERGFNCQSFG